MTNSKNGKRISKKNISFGVAILLLVVFIVIGYFLYTTPPSFFGSQEATKEKGFGQGEGGDPKAIINYNDQAVAAWKSGDKEKAQELAQKGVEAGKSLTSAQMKELPDPIETSYNLQTMAGGQGPSNE